MSTTTNTAETRTTLTARLGTSRYGNPMPRIDVRTPPRSHHRVLGAALHELAAKVERATPLNESWCVAVEHGRDDSSGWVYLELAGDSKGEVERAMELLNRVVG